MSIVNKEDFTKHFDYSLKQQLRGDIAMSYIYELNEFSWFDNDTMKRQMKKWRKLAKEGNLIMRKYNNKKFDYNGREYYLLEVQGNKCYQNDPICLVGLYVAGIMVNGFGYVFLNENNRDKVFEYVMEGITIKDEYYI